MTDNNTMGKISYVFDNLFWGVLMWFWYRLLVFAPVGTCTKGQSKIILLVLVAVFMLAGVAITFARRRNSLSVAVNVLCPFQLYAVVSYWPFFPKWVAATVTVAVVLGLVFLVLVVFRRLQKNHPRWEAIMISRIKHGLLGARTVAVVCLCALLVPLMVVSLTGRSLFHVAASQKFSQTPLSEWTVKNKIETVAKIDQEVWENLTMPQRVDVLNTIKNIEMNYFGVVQPIELKLAFLEENNYGYYDHTDRQLVLDYTHVEQDSSLSVLDSLLHECYHVYSWAQIDAMHTVSEEYRGLLTFANACVYEEEFGNYADGNKNYDQYREQYCEKDARFYAKKSVPEYYETVEQYKQGVEES